MKRLLPLACVLILAGQLATCRAVAAEPPPPGRLAVAGMFTMVDFGADWCVPCRPMAPILEKLAREYQGRAAVVLVDAGRHRNLARRFEVAALPTQIFFDRKVNEVYRHVGFWGKEGIADRLSRLGVR